MARYDSYRLFDLLDDDRQLNKTAVKRPGLHRTEIEEKTEAILNELKISASVKRITRSPAYFRLILSLEDYRDLSKLKESEDLICERLGVELINISVVTPSRAAESKDVAIEIVRPCFPDISLRSVYSTMILYSYSGMAVPLGRAAQGLSIPYDLEDGLLISGKDKKEIDNLMKLISLALIINMSPNDLEIACTGKMTASFEAFFKTPHMVKEEGARFVRAEAERRRMLFYGADCRGINDYMGICSFLGQKQPSKIAWFVELDSLNTNEKAESLKLIKEIAGEARELGISVILSTSSPEIAEKENLRSLFKNRAAFRTDTEEESRMVLGLKGAVKLAGRGDMLFSSIGRTMRIQNPTVSDGEIRRLTGFISENYKDGSLIFADSEKKDDEDLKNRVIKMALERGGVSSIIISRRFKVSAEIADKMIDMLGELGYCEIRTRGKIKEAILKEGYGRRASR